MIRRPGRARWPLPAAAALIGLAGLTGTPALFALGAGLGIATAGAWVAVLLAARRLEVTRTVPARELREQEPLRVHFAVRCASWLPVVVEAQDRSGEWVALGGTLDLDGGPRGAHRLAPSVVRVRDVLGIAGRRLRAGEPEPILVLPRPQTAAVSPLYAAAGRDPEPDGLEAYAPGMPIARIHWPSLARGAGLHARRVASAAAGDATLVVVDTAGGPDRAAVDWTARVAAGETLELIRAGGCRVLLPGDQSPTTVADLRAWAALQQRLALLDAGGDHGTALLLGGETVIRIAAADAPGSDGGAATPRRALPAFATDADGEAA